MYSTPPPAESVRFVVPEPRPTSDVPYHHDRAPGQKYLLADPTVVPETPIYVALRRIDEVPACQPKWLDPHAHNCDSYYVFLGDGAALTGLLATVGLGGHERNVAAPALVRIPPLELHEYWLVEGSGWFIQVTENPTYEGSLAPQGDWRESDMVGEDLIAVPALVEGRLRFGPHGGRLKVEALLLADSTTVDEDHTLQEFALDVILDRGQAAGEVEITAHWDVEIRRPPVAVAPAGQRIFVRVESGAVVVVRLGLA